MSTSQERRPAAGGYEATESLSGLVSSISPNTDDWQQLAAHLDGTFVVMVETTHGRYRRRVWLTLAAAERAAEKARDAGHTATIVLAQLKPLHRVEGSPPAHETLGRVVVASGGAA